MDSPSTNGTGTDDALARARAALRGVDTELDLDRVRARSLARARAAAGAADDPARPSAVDAGASVEVLVHGAGRRGARTRRPRAWALAAAAAVVVVVSLAATYLTTQGGLPGVLPGSPVPALPGPADRSPSPGPTVWLTPAEAIDRAATATSFAGCELTTSSTLDGGPVLRTDQASASVGAPKVALDEKPLAVLQQVTVGTVLGLPAFDGTDQELADELLLDDDGGRVLARVRLFPASPLVLGGDVTRIDLLIDTTTWLPRAAVVSARSGQAAYEVRSELRWAGCTGPSMAPTGGTDGP
ncbi:hypothetical protein ACFQHV_02570 [Promicromonospora thailandica]|uniref:Uncharacterized protein n=1 Tax=Promicromonospora thailandica TaxID=765201 RepID=A0A9X2G739_9MICO|nr:hypothetical protein [Promicromonospora thailandica]MCP2266948.1 hypothetical protein [Promicromonospora thailandica]BFF16782.1 hypothetical protein GCM10025730_03030 [Promicromonospora thailandica]